MHPYAASQGKCRPTGRKRRDDRLDFDLQTRARRRGRASIYLRFWKFLPRRPKNRFSRIEAQESARRLLGRDGTGVIREHVRDSRHPELAIHLLPAFLLVSRPQPFLSKRLLSSLRRQSG